MFNPLSAMPGDLIHFSGAEGPSSGIVRTAGWQPSPNGGKVWSYELLSGEIVHNLSVTGIEKKKLEVLSETSEISDRQSFMNYLDEINLSPILKTAIHCLMMNTIKDLEVAHHLISTRLRQLYELELKNSSDRSGEINN